jgi:hypothetical protein
LQSQELVASDEEPSGEVEAATHAAEIATPAAPTAAVNGRRKSTSRKPRKKPLVRNLVKADTTQCLSSQSDETISPEDENDDPMEVDAPVVASPLPVRSGKLCPC